MKFFYFIFILFLGYTTVIEAQNSLNVELFGQIAPHPGRSSGCWGWTAADGSEYALLGAFSGTSIININNKNNIYEAGFVPSTTSSNWREITVIGHHAYVVTEEEDEFTGMQVIDLSYLPDSVHLVTTYQTTFKTAHTISKNITKNDSYVYISGTITGRGVHILDISEPANPVEVGLYAPGYYIHDCHVRGDRLYGAAIGEGTLDILDISDRTQPKVINRISTPFTHSCWTSQDGNYLFSTDEIDGLLALVWDIRDETDVKLVANYTGNDSSLVHNVYIREEFAFISHNTEGLRVVDFSRPEVPVEVGYYDTHPGLSGGFFGLWSAFPFFSSGKIIGANRADGLYIFTFNNTHAGYIFGEVTNAQTGEIIPDAHIELVEANQTTNSDFYGLFKIGAVGGDSTEYTLEVKAANYMPVTYPISLQEKDSLWYDILLEPYPTGITNLDHASSIELYPNPIKELATFDFKTLKTKDLELRIIDLSGQVVDSYTSLKDKKVQLSLGHLPIGIYFYMLENADNTVVQRGKFVIAR